MHELPVTQSILKIALEHAGKANSKCITDLHVVTAELSSMVDDSIQFYWDIIAKDTIAEGATLHFRRVAVEMQCRSCSETAIGSTRVVDVLAGELLPRIC
jgi:hydrogenase nickel incorporation protein HypA/HybF